MAMKKLLAVFTVLLAGLALANVTRTLLTAGSGLDHGDWRRLSDGGFAFTMYGAAPIQEDGGQEILGPVACEPGSWGSAPAVCLPLWRAAVNL